MHIGLQKVMKSRHCQDQSHHPAMSQAVVTKQRNIIHGQAAPCNHCANPLPYACAHKTPFCCLLFTNTAAAPFCCRLLSPAQCNTPASLPPTTLPCWYGNKLALEYGAIIHKHMDTLYPVCLHTCASNSSAGQRQASTSNRHPRTCRHQQKDSSDSAYPSKRQSFQCGDRVPGIQAVSLGAVPVPAIKASSPFAMAWA